MLLRDELEILAGTKRIASKSNFTSEVEGYTGGQLRHSDGPKLNTDPISCDVTSAGMVPSPSWAFTSLSRASNFTLVGANVAKIDSFTFRK